MKTVRQISICFSIMSWGLLEHIGQWRCSVFSIRCHHKSQLLCLISESGPHILQSNTKHTICLHQYTYRLKSVLKWAFLVNECSDNFAIIKLHILLSGIALACKISLQNMNNCVHQKLYIISGAHIYAQMQKNCLMWRLPRWPVLNQLHINNLLLFLQNCWYKFYIRSSKWE